MSLYPFDAMPKVSCIVVVMTASTDLRQCSVHPSHHSPVSTSYLTSAQIFIMRCARNILSGYLAYSFAMLNSVSCHFPLILHGLDLIFMVSFSLILYISCLVLNEISNHGNNPHITILSPHQLQFTDTECRVSINYDCGSRYRFPGYQHLASTEPAFCHHYLIRNPIYSAPRSTRASTPQCISVRHVEDA